MTMTLRQVSAMLRDRSPVSLWQQSEEMADAIDAHIAGMGELAAKKSSPEHQTDMLLARMVLNAVVVPPAAPPSNSPTTGAIGENGNG